MSSMIEDRRPFVKAMQNYHLMEVDATTSQASLNIPEDNGKRFRAEQPGYRGGINIRLLFFIIAIIFFVLSLILFIATIVAYYKRPNNAPSDVFQSKHYTGSDSGGGGGASTEIPFIISKFADKTGSSSSNRVPTAAPPAAGGFESDQWSVTTVNDRHVRPGQLVWSDEFEDFNRSSWFHITGGDTDNHFYFNVNNRSNSYAQGGTLYLKPTYSEDRFGKAYIENGTLLLGILPSEKCQNDSSIICWKGTSPIVHPIMAPMITSKNFFKFRYGKLQIRAKMPSGDWIEPIISLQPDKSTYGEDLRSGQIHFVDTRGNRKLYSLDKINVGSEQNCPDIRYGYEKNKKLVFYCVNTDEDEGFDRDFHLYEFEWTPKSLTLKIDGEGVVGGPYPRPSFYKLWSKGRSGINPWANADNPVVAPFDQSFYLTIGVSVGGTSGFFSDDFENKPYPKPWNNTDPKAPKTFWDARAQWEPTWINDRAALQIDFIRLFSLNETITD